MIGYRCILHTLLCQFIRDLISSNSNFSGYPQKPNPVHAWQAASSASLALPDWLKGAWLLKWQHLSKKLCLYLFNLLHHHFGTHSNGVYLLLKHGRGTSQGYRHRHSPLPVDARPSTGIHPWGIQTWFPDWPYLPTSPLSRGFQTHFYPRNQTLTVMESIEPSIHQPQHQHVWRCIKTFVSSTEFNYTISLRVTMLIE